MMVEKTTKILELGERERGEKKERFERALRLFVGLSRGVKRNCQVIMTKAVFFGT
jgi:hypothetical protein